MKSGNPIPKFKPSVQLEDFADAHRIDGCTGKFALEYIQHYTYTGSTLGPVLLPSAPCVVCPECHATFLVDGFGEWVEGVFARGLVLTSGSLTKNQIRFLRQFLDITQEKMANLLGLGNRQEVCRMESENDKARHMPFDKQLRLKLLVAEKLDITDLSLVYGINKQDDLHQVDLASAVDLEDLKEG